MKYTQIYDGDWVTPVMNGYKVKCCDCGLVHVINIRVKRPWFRPQIQFQATRDNRATAAARRAKQALPPKSSNPKKFVNEQGN